MKYLTSILKTSETTNKTPLFKDIGWGFTDNSETRKSKFNNYAASLDLPELKNKKVTVITVFNDLLFVGLQNGTILQWNISSLDRFVDNPAQIKPVMYDNDLVKIYDSDKMGHTGSIDAICYSKDFGKLVSLSKKRTEDTRQNIIVWNYHHENQGPSVSGMYKCDPKTATEITCLSVTTVKECFVVFATSARDICFWDIKNDKSPTIYFSSHHTKKITSLGVLLPPALKDPPPSTDAETNLNPKGKIGIISVGSDSLMISHVVREVGSDHNVEPFLFEKGHLKSISCLEVHFPWIEKSQHAVGADSSSSQLNNNTQNAGSRTSLSNGKDQRGCIVDKAPVVLTGSLDNTIIVWDYETTNKIKQLIGHSGMITAIKVSDRDDDGSPPIVISASTDRSIILWNLILGCCIRSIKHSQPFMTLAVQDSEWKRNHSEKAKYHTTGLLLFSSDQHKLLVYDLRHTKRIQKGALSSAINTVQVDTEENGTPTFLIGDETGEFCLRNCNNLNRGKPMKVHQNRITTCKIYKPPEIDPIVISGDGKGQLKVWTFLEEVGSNTAAPPLTRSRKSTSSDTPPKRELLDLTADQYEVLAIDIYDPRLCKSQDNLEDTQGRKGSVVDLGKLQDNLEDTQGRKGSVVDLGIPCVFIGGREKKIRIYDFTVVYDGSKLQDEGQHLIKEVSSSHRSDIRSIMIYHPRKESHRPLLITADSYGTTPVLWDLETVTELRSFSEGIGHSFITIYYPPDDSDTDSYSKEFLVPAIATGGNDGKICVWNLSAITDLKSEETRPRKSFQAHESSISTIVLHTPRDMSGGNPLLITGSLDKLIRIWDFFTGERLHTLIGHFDRVNCLCVYDSPALKVPILVSGGNDDQILVWNDALYPQSFMPLRETVRNAFYLDYHCKKGTEWPLISALAEQYGFSLFAENSQLFMMAVNYGRSDFLIIFFDYLVLTLPTMRSAFLKNNAPLIQSAEEIMRPSQTEMQTYVNTNNPIVTDASGADEDEWSTSPPSPMPRLKSNVVVRKGKEEIAYDRVTEKDIEAINDDALVEMVNLYRFDILYLAIIRHDLLAVQVILLAWLKNLNQDMESVLFQRLYHPMYYLPFDTMKELHLYYPSEFIFFMTKLQLVRNHDSLMKETQKSGLTCDERMYFHGSDEKLNYYETFWEPLSNTKKRIEIYNSHPVIHYRFIPKVIRDGVKIGYIQLLHYWIGMKEFFGDPILPQPVTSLVVPFCSAKNLLTYLDWFVEVSHQLDDVSIFNSEIVIIMLQYFWVAYGRRAHTLTFLKYLIFLGLFLLCMYVFEPRWHHNPGMIILNVLTLCWFVYYGWEEFTQLKQNVLKRNKFFGSVLRHVCDLWNLIDFIIIVGGTVGILLRFSYGDDTPTGRGFLAITSVAMWFKILYFLRPFSTTGPLGKASSSRSSPVMISYIVFFVLSSVAMILLIAREIVVFLFILLCLITGFAQGFWLLSNNNPTNDFGTVSQSLLNSFLFTIGQNVDPTFDGIASPFVATVLLIGFFLTMTILMLNLLIALMGDVFSKARSRGSALWRKEQAAIILEQSFLYTKDLELKEYLLVLKYSSEAKNAPMDYQEFLKGYQSTIERITSALEKNNQS